MECVTLVLDVREVARYQVLIWHEMWLEGNTVLLAKFPTTDNRRKKQAEEETAFSNPTGKWDNF